MCLCSWYCKNISDSTVEAGVPWVFQFFVYIVFDGIEKNVMTEGGAEKF